MEVACENYMNPFLSKSKIMPGMLSTKRKEDATDEDDIIKVSSTRNYTCKNCLQRGHNTRSCKNPTQNRPPKVKKKRGRPRIHIPVTNIVYETQDAETQGKIKDLRDSGYTSVEIEEALSVEKDEEWIDKTRLLVYDKHTRRSERIVKIKLSKPVYDKDGGGSCMEKALTLD